MPKIRLKIMTHTNVVFDNEVDAIYAIGENGEFGILPNHISFMTTLKISIVRAIQGEKTIKIAVMGGIFQIKENDAIILTNTAELDKDIDVIRAQEAKERAQARLSNPQEKINQTRAEIALQKAITRLEAAKDIKNHL